MEAAFRVESPEVDAVRIEVRRNDGSGRALLTFRLEYVGNPAKAQPWLSVHVGGPALLAAIGRAAVQWDGVLGAPWQFPIGTPATADAPCVVIWRTLGRPIDYGRFVTDLVQDTLGVTDPARIRAHRDDIEVPRLLPRLVEDPARHGVARRYRHGVSGVCFKCGRDLRDPAYAKIGIGPECIKSYSSADVHWFAMITKARRAGRRPILQAKTKPSWLDRVRTQWHLS